MDPSGGLEVLDDPEPLYTSSGTVVWWMTGGTAGETYEVTVHIVTSGGREDERPVRVSVGDR